MEYMKAKIFFTISVLSFTIVLNGFSQLRVTKPTYDYPYHKEKGYCLGEAELNIDKYIYEITEDSIYFRSPITLRDFLMDKDEEEFVYYLLDASEELASYELGFRERLFFPIHQIDNKIFIQRSLPRCKLIKVLELKPLDGNFPALVSDTNHEFYKLKAIANDPEFTYDSYALHRVVCQTNITSRVIQEVSEKLESEGYLDDEISEFNEELKNALYEFQFDNNLPIGFLDVETLNLLGFWENQIELLVGTIHVRDDDNPNFNNMGEKQFLKWWKKHRVTRYRN